MSNHTTATVTQNLPAPPELVHKYRELYQIIEQNIDQISPECAPYLETTELESADEITAARVSLLQAAQAKMISNMRGWTACADLNHGYSTTMGIYGDVRDGFHFWYQMKFERT